MRFYFSGYANEDTAAFHGLGQAEEQGQGEEAKRGA